MAAAAATAAAATASAAVRRGIRRKIATYNVQGLVPYGEAWRLQQALVAQRIAWQKAESPGYDALLVLEHQPVYTLGRSAKAADVKFPLDGIDDPAASEKRGFDLYRTDRGGQVTWHGPGQVVCYPVVDLRHHKKDLRWYVRGLEEVVIRVLARYGIQGGRDPEHTGVWANGGRTKVAAIGVSASRWVTSHGLALNVCPDLGAFDRIVPCGVQDRGVGSIHSLLLAAGQEKDEEAVKKGITTAQVRYDLMEAFEEVFPTFELCIQEAPALPDNGAEGIVLTEDYEADEVRAGVEAPRSSQ